jgi:cation transport protein ChaC
MDQNHQNHPPVLTREAIQSGELRRKMQAHAARAGETFIVNSEEALTASRQSMFENGKPEGDVWLFGYGSLIWNPAIEYAASTAMTIYGYHRRFCLWSNMGRGSPEQPGLMLGLDRGGACRGLGFRIPQQIAERELDIIWRREMVSDSYRPTWLKGRDEHGKPIQAIGFTVRRDHDRYTGPVAEESMAEIIAKAHGFLGPCAEYLINTVEHLNAMSMPDKSLQRLYDLVIARQQHLI